MRLFRVRGIAASTLLLLTFVVGAVQGATLSSIDVTPFNPTVNPGDTEQFSAIGTFDDASIHVLGATVSDVSSAGNVTCALLAGGVVKCWGNNFYGQLGNGTTTDSTAPVSVIGIGTATAVAVGPDHTCALLGSGAIQCWGHNNSGQLGDGTTTDSAVPVTVSGISTATAVAAGNGHSCALLASGAVRCWGANFNGQLGNGTTTASGIPVAVSGITATAISTGDFHSCALLSSGVLRCWGNNNFGQLGDGTTTDSASPVTVSGISTATAISAGVYHTCARLSGGALQCWGLNSDGELGDGTNSNRSTPAYVSGISNATAVAAGYVHSCALLASGTMQCWGDNAVGELGDGTRTASKWPVTATVISTATAIAVGDGNSCALVPGGAVQCWGSNFYGQLGDGTTATITTPVTIDGVDNATGVAAGDMHSCTVLDTGEGRCWGHNNDGQLGDGTTDDSDSPVPVSGVSNGTLTAAGDLHTCAVLGTGAVECWGDNTYGQLGDGTTTQSASPVTVSGIGTATAIAAGAYYSCALLADGTVQCWGENSSGQLGNGTTTDAAAPVTVSGITTATGISAGLTHTCALLADGTVQCWGINTVTNSPTPVTVSGISTGIAIAIGDHHSCALLASGGVRCWGDNEYGQLGDGTTTLSMVPVAVVGITNATAIAAGGSDTCALLADGRVKCWGYNLKGQLGDGTTTSSSTPVTVSGITDAMEIAVGHGAHSCVLLHSRQVQCWGDNSGKQSGRPWSYTMALTVIGTPGVAWSSGTSSVASINASGLATALSAGTSTIAATAGVISGSTLLTVAAPTHSLSLLMAGTGSGTVGGAGSYPIGATAAVSATADPGSTFTGWTGPDAAECATGSVVMNADKICTANFSLNPPLAFTNPPPASLSGTAGSPYSITLTATGGTAPYSWQLVSGSLPGGLTLSSGGVISGTPTTYGTYNFSVQVTDSLGANVTAAMTLTIDPAPLAITTASLPDGTTGTSYGQTLSVTGGVPPYNWTLASGSLPPGLTLSSGGVISGTPTAGGSYTFSATATDSLGANVTGALALTVTVSNRTLSLLTAGTGSGTVTGAGAYPFGNTAPVSAAADPGSTFAGWTGPDATECATGAVVMTADKSCTANFSLNPPLAFTSPPPASLSGTVGSAFSITLTATGGTAPYTWQLVSGALPGGLTLSSGGVISGTPTTYGTYNFSVKVTDSLGANVTAAMTLTIDPAPLAITTSSLFDGAVGTSYSRTLSATGGVPAYTWTLASGSLPPGLTLSSGGLISGTPTTYGTFNFSVTVTDFLGANVTSAMTLTIDPASLVITTASLPSGTMGTSYNQTLGVTGGVSPYTWTLASGSLPPGLNLSSGGVISGTPTTYGTFNFSVKATDSLAANVSTAMTLSIASGPLVIAPVTLLDGTTGAGYSQALSATGGILPYTWSLASGSLPPGLSLSSGGVIMGTPTVIGTFVFTVQLHDAVPATATRSLSITVINTPVGTAVQVPLGTVTPSYTEVTVKGNTTTTLSSTPPRPIATLGYVVRPTSQYQDIVTTAVYTGPITVCMPYNDSAYTPQEETHLHLLHLPSSAMAWEDITTTLDPVNNIICGITTSLSPFVVALESSTAVTVTSFQASRGAGGAELVWVTQAETDNLGFRVLRSDAPNGPYLPLGNAQIPARGGLGMTMTYSVTDSSAQAGKAYYYKLEDISYTGTVSMVGPVVLDAGISAAQVASTTGTPKAAPRTTSTASSGAIARSVSSGSVAAGSATIATAVTPTVLFPNVAAAPSVQPAAAGFETPTSVALQASPPASVPAQTPAAPSRLSQAPLYGNAAAGTIANSAEPPLPANDRPLRFSVAITDARGNMITVSREEALAGPSEVTPVKVEQGKQVVVSWTVRHLAARGFALLRRVKGNKEYETVVTYIPNFALDASGTYRYRIIDATAKPGTQYEYLRTAQDWGVQVGAATPPK